jgi:hypothetical protein
MRTSSKSERLTDARRRAAGTAREATLRADAAWQRAYSETFSPAYDETLTELLAKQKTEAIRTEKHLHNIARKVAA